MGTINQPKPSQPGSPVPDPSPLQPGGAERTSPNVTPATEVNPQTPETRRQEGGEHRGPRR